MAGVSPRFRRDLTATPVEADGVVYVEVTDPGTGKAFRFYDFEHAVAQALDGRPLAEVAEDLRARAELDLTEEQLGAFAEQLATFGFLAEPGVEDAPGFFAPQAIEEQREFSGAKLGGATPGPDLDLPVLDMAPAPFPVALTPAPETQPGAARTLTAYPPELLPNDWATPPPELLPAGKSTKTPPPERATPANGVALDHAPLDAALDPDLPAPSPARGPSQGAPGAAAELTPAPARRPRPEGTPPPIPLAALHGARPEADKPRRDQDQRDAASKHDALTTEVPVVGGLDLGLDAHLDRHLQPTAEFDLPSLPDRLHFEPPAPKAAAPSDTAPSDTAPSAAAAIETTPSPFATALPTAPLPATLSPPAPQTDLPAADQAALPEHLDFLPAGAEPDEARPSEATVADMALPGERDLSAFAGPRVSAPPDAVDEDAVTGTARVGHFARSLAPDLGSPAVDLPMADLPMAEVPGAGHDKAAEKAPDARERPTRELRGVTDEAAAVPVAARPSAARPASNDSAPEPAAIEAPFAEIPASAGRRAWIAYAILGVAAAVVMAITLYHYWASDEPPAVSVREMVPVPKTIYRYWDASARVELGKTRPIAFEAEGHIAEVVKPGAKFGAGDTLAMLESGKRFRLEEARATERLKYYEERLVKMTAENNRAEMRQSELKVAEKKRLIAEAQANIAKHSLIATEPGEVGEVLVVEGSSVKPGAPVLRTKGTNHRALFELPREQADKARQLGFCRAEIDEKPLDCSLSAEGGDETHVAIDLPNDPLVAEGKAVRLARDKLDAVFSVPASALVRVGDTDRLYVIGPNDRAVLRVLSVADRNASEVIVTQGIDVGDRVIVEPPPTLRPDARVLTQTR